ncbi:CHRD domain-containing protein [Kibdelosporangium philippinense]|uniref:CHRD domain-containing protein n=1 Tax=Kibdelosporangium philippinense TaxID=211113 RepID=A0ABS8ZS65_9PSEU|nr:CHRD domain-containing protein [Kibdelosporangium philippinense]MCE7009446.1 CHRD domain-containing protein [Kibdelosporangium philippinense]
MPANKTIAATILGAAITLGVLSPGVAAAHEGDHAAPSGVGEIQPVRKPAKGKSLYFIAELDGKQEVAEPGKIVNDPDARAQALVEVKGDRITFALNWKNTSQLALGHIHEAVAGKNGAVAATLFGTAMPETVTSAAGQVVVDATLAAKITQNPTGFYVNLHSTEFKDGAVRGQLKALNKRINPMDIVKAGKLRAFANGAQEVREPGKKVGDRDGLAIGFAQPLGNRVNFAAAWVNIAAPTLIHAHEGVAGKNGPVVAPFVGTPVPAGIFAVAGSVNNVDKAAADRLKRNPKGFYLNVHTGEFPDGAVRGHYHS